MLCLVRPNEFRDHCGYPVRSKAIKNEQHQISKHLARNRVNALYLLFLQEIIKNRMTCMFFSRQLDIYNDL